MSLQGSGLTILLLLCTSRGQDPPVSRPRVASPSLREMFQAEIETWLAARAGEDGETTRRHGATLQTLADAFCAAEWTATPAIVLARYEAMSTEGVRRVLAAIARFLEGQRAFRADDYALARERLEEAVAEFRELHDDYRSVETLRLLALLDERDARFEDATRRLEEAAGRAAEIGARIAEEQALQDLGVARFRSGRSDFEGPLRRARDLARDRGDAAAETSHLLSLARLSLFRGELRTASCGLREALGREGLDRRQRAELLALFGRVHVEQRDFGPAGIAFGEADRILTDLGESRGDLAAQVRFGLAEVAFWRGRLEDAEREVAAAAEASGQGSMVALALILRGRLAALRGRHEEAIALFDEAAGSARSAGGAEVEARARTNAARSAAALGRFAEAADRLRPLFEDERLSPRSPVALGARVQLAMCAFRAGDFPRAEVLAKEVMDAVEEDLARAEPGSGLDYVLQGWPLRAFETAIAAVLAQDARRGGEAFELAERSKARPFLVELDRYGVNPDEDLAPELREAGREALSRVLRITSALRTEKDPVQAERLRAAQVRESKNLETVKDAAGQPRVDRNWVPKPCTLESARDLLREGRVLLEYFVGEEHSFLFVLEGERLDVLPFPDAPSLGREIDSFLSVLFRSPRTPKARESLSEASRTLTAILLPGDLASRVVDREVYVIPDGPLFRLPFESLAAPSAEGPLRSLGDLSVFAYGHSAGLLATLAGRPLRLERGILAAANPALAAEERLPYGEAEAREAASRFPRNRSRLIAGSKFTKRNLLALDGEVGVVHLVTHTVTSNQRLGFRVTPAEDDPEGVLRFHEVAGLRIQADLVVLSGCETGRGALIQGVGSYGVVFPFFFNGASRVVLSLWPVRDAAVPRMMRTFYDRLLETRSVPLALALARRPLAAEGRLSDPSLYAAFVAYGPF